MTAEGVIGGGGSLSMLIVNPMGGKGWGGVERWLMDLSLGLRERGHRIAMAGRPGSLWLERCGAQGFATLSLPLRTDFHLGDARALSRFMTEHGVDVVSTKLHRGIRAAGFAAKLAGAPPVVAFMGLVEARRGLRYRLTYELFLDGVVTLTERMRADIIHEGALEPETVHAIPYGVRVEGYRVADGVRAEVRQELGLPVDAPIALAIGRLNQQKRFDRLLASFRTVRDSVPDAQLVIAGTGSLRAELEARRAALGLEACAHLIGFRSDIPRLLAAADTLVLSSDDEGLPMVVLEAMASARAVVSTTIGSIDEQVIDGVTGRLVPAGDGAALASALTAVLSDRDLAARMGRAGYERVSTEFPLSRCIERTEAYLLSLRDRRRGGVPSS